MSPLAAGSHPSQALPYLMSATIDSDFVRQRIWPVVVRLVQTITNEEPTEARRLLTPQGPAAMTLDLVGPLGLGILLKTFWIASHHRFRLTRVFVTTGQNDVYLEYNWEQEEDYHLPSLIYSVTVRLQGLDDAWQVVEINPAPMDAWFTSEDARSHLLELEQSAGQPLPPMDWLLPLALVAGRFPLPFQPEALRDEVEALFLPQLQLQGFGLYSWIGGRRLWRDFVAQAQPTFNEKDISAWAAAAHYLMCEQDRVGMSQAAVGKLYNVPLASLLPRIRRLRQTLGVNGIDERYTSLRAIQIPVHPPSA